MSEVPVHRSLVVTAGSTRRSVFVSARSTDGGPATGLGAATVGLSAACLRSGDSAARPIPLVPVVGVAHAAGGFAEIDPEVMPGWYRLDLPDEVLAPSARQVVVTLRCGGVAFDPVDIVLVGYDPADPFALGLASLGDAGRRAFARRSLPRIAGDDARRAE